MSAKRDKLASLVEKVKKLLRIHIHSRRLLYPEAGSDEGHIINENTVVRLAAELEAAKIEPKQKCPKGVTKEGWIGVKALIFMRDKILHDNGNFVTTRDKTGVEYYKKFMACINVSLPDVGKKLILADPEVLQPLMWRYMDYVKAVLDQAG